MVSGRRPCSQRRQRSSSGLRRSSQRERQRGSAPPLPQTWRRLESSLRASSPGRLASRRWLLSDRRCRSSRSRQRRSGTRRPLGRTPPQHRAAEAEERRRAKAEEAEAARTEGRRQLAEGRYLSAKAAGTHKRGPNKRARKNARKKENKALAAEQEAVEAQQAQLAAERAAFALHQAQAGAPLDLFEQARAASAAIADSGLRRQHENMVKVSAAHMDALVTAPAEGPARLDQRLAGAAATIVAGTKKVTSDLKQRQRQEECQCTGAVRSAERAAAWMTRHGLGGQQGRHVDRASRQHAGVRRTIRHERVVRRDLFGGGRSGGGSSGGAWRGRGGGGGGRR